MKLKILSWKLDGQIIQRKESSLRTLVCVHGSKIENIYSTIAHSIGVGRFVDWRVLEAEGTTKGILLLWDKRKLDMLDSEIGSFSISCLFINVEDDFQWTFTSVYGPIEGNRRELFCEELGSIKGLWEGPWC